MAKKIKPLSRKQIAQILQSSVDSAMLRYADTRNPVFVWEAIADCTRNGIKFPPLVTDYLLRVSGRMAELSRSSIPKKGQISAALASALEFRNGRTGAANPFTKITEDSHELMIAFEVYDSHTRNWWNQREGLLREGTKDWGTVFKEVAAAHPSSCTAGCRQISVATVKRCWYQHALKVIPPHLVKQAQSNKLDDILR